MKRRSAVLRTAGLPALPETLAPLGDLGGNLWWTWDPEAPALWEQVDHRLWDRTGHNPVAMLRRISPRRLRQLADDPEFARDLQQVQRRMRAYLSARTPSKKQSGRSGRGLMAYFSMEFALHESLSVYAGGLGVLAGDHMKSASDLDVPLVGVGILWRQGYVRQRIDAAGRQEDWYERKKPEELPLHPLLGPNRRPLKVQVQLGDERIAVQAWRVDVGRTFIVLLDTDLPENPPRHRRLTDRLYVGDRDARIRQEVVLGVGGWRLLAAMKLPVVGCHLNEGHAAFCCLERLDETMRQTGVGFEEACRRVAATTVFTTHTPVPEGNEVFAQELVEKYVGYYGRRLGIGRESLMGLGLAGKDCRGGGCEKGFSHQPFGMTPLALRLSDNRNGVSKLHGEVSRKMWRGLWPNRKVERVPIGSITNGVHLSTWLHPKMVELLDEYLPKGWKEKQDEEAWAAVQTIPDEALWQTHLAMKAELLDVIRGRFQGPSRRTAGLLQPDVLTIGFARRFTAYKRASLVLSDARRLALLVGDSRRPVRIIFAGKSHPADGGGKALIAEVVKQTRSAKFKGRVVFLEDYDMAVSRKMIAGVDVWLNTPQRPKEASGTSGMKPAAHGGLNLSILDGWWPEACRDGTNGWAIGKGEDYDGTAAASRRDAASLYQRLERDVIPLYYRRGRDGLPGGWIRMMKHTLATIPPVFNELPDGVYHYKILVNGCIWLEDQNADPRFREPDNRGGFNSGVLVGLDGTKLGPAKPNRVDGEALKHDPACGRYFTPISADLAVLTLRVLAGDVERVDMITAAGEAAIPMRRVDSQFGFDYWSAQVFADGDGPTYRDRLSYVFRLTDGSERVLFGAKGIAPNESEPSYFKPDVRMSFETPDWAKKAVWYQIFPERFRNGDPSNDPPRTVPWTHEWFKPYKGKSRNAETPKRRDEEGARKDSHTSDSRTSGSTGGEAAARDFVEEGTFQQFIFDRRYGGDLQGVREKLPYLRDLGVTAIYFNPVFIGESLHKYDASDFRHIDDFFGVKDSLQKIKGETTDPATWQWSDSDRVFLDFLKEAHRLGFKVILDGVFNHVGRDFWAFKDVLKNKQKSPYADWFEIKSWEPFHYKAWDGDDGFLPVLKHDEAKGLIEPIREHLFAVTRRWMDPDGDGDPSDGIDGWRLDVASDINANFWRDWRKLVKSINPDAYIVAELWEESRVWLDGQTFDAVMNYPFARACQKFFVNQKKRADPSEFDKQLRENLGWYQPQVNYVLQNLLDSHDTDRAASMFMNPDLEYDKANRLQDNGPDYNPARPTPDCYEKLKLEVMFQMCFLGAPMVYYGGEVGMYGADDPSSRKPMYWEDLMPYDDPDERIVPGLRDHFRRMIAIRNTHPALQLGSFETLLANDSLRMYAFARTLGDETIVVVLNNSDKPHRLNVPSPWPAEARIIRLDDPAAYEVVDASKDDPKARPAVRLIEGHKSPIKTVDGRLKGITLGPRSGVILRRAE